jgi:hypothetical protein
MTPSADTAPHPYLRAYMAGITIPTAFLLVILAVFVTVHRFHHEPLPIDRVLVFPMAIAPNLWGVWNMVYVAVRRRRDWPPGLHGLLLAMVIGPLGWSIAQTMGVPTAALGTAATAFPLVMVLYYLLWKYGVAALNEILGVA